MASPRPRRDHPVPPPPRGRFQNVVDPRARTPRCEVRGLRLRVGNSQPRQQSSPQGASTPRPRIAAPNGACGPIPVGARFNCGSLLGCEPAQGWARATRWVSFPRVMTLVVLASPPRLPIENSEEPFSRSLRCFQGVTEAGPCGPVRGLGEATYTGALRSWGSGLSVTHCFGSDPSKTPTAFVSRSLHSLFLPFSFCPEQIALTT